MENINRGTQEEDLVEQLGEHLAQENLTELMFQATKGDNVKPLKETNLLANQKDKFSDESLYSKTFLFSELAGEILGHKMATVLGPKSTSF